MSKTIKAIERHMRLPVRSGRRGDMDSSRGELGLESRAPNFVAEWQQRGPETLSGLTLRKLRLVLAPQSVTIASAAG